MRYLMTFSYDGLNFSGYQIQKNKRTIEEEIEKVLTKINHNKEVKIVASGRTDAGVHALAQTAHFDMEEEKNLKDRLNKLLPKDIYVVDIKKVDKDFHARYHKKRKTYIYKLNMGNYNPFLRNYVYQYNKKLNIDKMKKAITYFIGTKDYTTFASSEKEDMVRTIYDASILVEKEEVTFTFIGDGFLQYQIRNMVGSLLEVGMGKKEVLDIPVLLDKKDRKLKGLKVPPEGLYLKDVKYEEK